MVTLRAGGSFQQGNERLIFCHATFNFGSTAASDPAQTRSALTFVSDESGIKSGQFYTDSVRKRVHSYGVVLARAGAVGG